MQNQRLTDRYGRSVDVLRITVTHRCNFNCIFCHMEGEDINSKIELDVESIGIVAEAFSRIGVRKFKITGGEPLLRRDIIDIIKAIKTRTSAEDISLTTNGFLLEELAKDLRDAGVDRVNISLHSLNREIFRYITGRDYLEKILRGVELAKKIGFKQIKINVVVLKNLNDNEIESFIELIRGRDDMVLQFIELHPVGSGAEIFKEKFVPLNIIEKKIIEKADRLRIRVEMHNRPLYHLIEGGYVEFVRPVSNPIFCAGCRRLRLTADGFLKPCLMRNDNIIDLKPILFNEDLTREEKIKNIIKMITLANDLREPFFKWRIDRNLDLIAEKYFTIDKSRGTIRIEIPKRSFS